jgi:SOS-response transcriptional repressor LexA
MLTQRQRDLLTFLEGYIRANGGVSPSYREMARALGLKSQSGIHRLIGGLEERGFIERRQRLRRSISIVEPDASVDDFRKLFSRIFSEQGPDIALAVLGDLIRDLQPVVPTAEIH